MTTIGIWTDLETHVGIWCGCFPAMQPILRRFIGSASWSRESSAALRAKRRSHGRRGYQRNGNGIDTATADETESRATAVGDSGYAASNHVELGDVPAKVAAAAQGEAR